VIPIRDNAGRTSGSEHGSTAESLLRFSGEIWTDARGQATVVLPSGHELRGVLRGELELLVGGGKARFAPGLSDPSFVIETDEPHAKVAWRLFEGERPR
jgi:hypothetical protein